jgi:GNAT superfamily N-acetyltransferase
MFADRVLAARIDRAEGRLCVDIAVSARALHPDRATLAVPISGGVAVYAGPSSPTNKVIGLGFDGPIDASALEEVEARWRERSEPVRIELAVLADSTIPPALSERGYHLHGFENVLGRRLDDTAHPQSPSNVTVEVLKDEDSDTWIDIAVTAFLNLDGTGSVADDALPREETERVLREFVAVPGFARYLARVDGRPAGEAAMRIDGDLAQVAGAGTLPEFRGRGVQKALLARRLADARAAGCDLAVVTTAPGTRSQDNVMRRGFVLLYTRAILVKRWDATNS